MVTELSKDVAVVATTLSNVKGKERFKHLKRELSEKDMKRLGEIRKVLEAYFKPRKNVLYKSFVFKSHVQQQDGPMMAFVEVLHQLSQTCNFGNLRHRLIQD